MAGAAALDDVEHLSTSLALNAEEMPSLRARLESLGFKTVPSAANFVMVPCESEALAQTVVENLLVRGVIVRGLRPFGFPSAFRITVGTTKENEFLMTELRKVVAENPGLGLGI